MYLYVYVYLHISVYTHMHRSMIIGFWIKEQTGSSITDSHE